MYYYIGIVVLGCIGVYTYREKIIETISPWIISPNKEEKGLSLKYIIHDEEYDVKIVSYKSDGKHYRIHIDATHDINIHETIENYKNEENTPFVRKIVQAELVSGNGEVENVSDVVRESQGPKYNFYKDLKITTLSWNHVLHEYDLNEWEILSIVDSFGQIHKININSNRNIDWNPNFTL